MRWQRCFADVMAATMALHYKREPTGGSLIENCAELSAPWSSGVECRCLSRSFTDQYDEVGQLQ